MNSGCSAGHGYIHAVINDQGNLAAVGNFADFACFLQIITPASILFSKLYECYATFTGVLHRTQKRFFCMISAVSYQI